jgi:hypothetical protein
MKTPGIGAQIAAEARAMKPTTSPIPLVRPYPAASQVWSAASPKTPGGRRFICVVDRGPDFVDSVEVDARGVRLFPALLKDQTMLTRLEAGEMPTAYRYEPTINGSATPFVGTNRAPQTRKENATMDTTETTATETKKAKKVPGIPRPKAEKKAKAPKAEKPAKVAKAPKADAAPSNRMADEDVVAFATKFLAKDPEAKKATVLAALRAAGHSCSQERFAPSFGKASRAAKAK